MTLIFVYGPPAAGKLTVAKIVSERTGLPLFHNHLIVDAVGTLFPFGSENFVRLREKFWLESMEAAIAEDRSFIFTFMPEPSVRSDFADRVKNLVEDAGADIAFVHLDLSRDGQLRRIANADRGKFGKLQDIDLLKDNFEQFEAATRAMPEPTITIDTAKHTADQSAELIMTALNLASTA